MSSPLADVFRDLSEVLGSLGVRWYVFGAQAAIMHGAARLTADVDVSVELGERPTVELVDALVRGGFELRVADAGGFVERTRVVPLAHSGSRFPVDVVLTGPGIEEMFLDRAEVHVIDEVAVPFASAADVVVMKVLAGRPKDIEDVEAILAGQGGELDIDLVRDSLGLLERALDRSDLLPELDRAIESVKSDD